MKGPLLPCKFPGCTGLGLGGRCAEHPGPARRDDRRSAAARGYDAAWRRFREWFLARHPLCADCQAEGTIGLAEEVHHLAKVADHPELRLVEANCLGLCKPHHSARTARGE